MNLTAYYCSNVYIYVFFFFNASICKNKLVWGLWNLMVIGIRAIHTLIFALHGRTMGVFTWTRITFRKTFRNVIQNVIGIVIWTTCVYMGYKRLSNHDQELRTASDILLLLRSPRALIDPCAYAWLQRAFLKCTRTNHVPKQLCVYMD